MGAIDAAQLFVNLSKVHRRKVDGAGWCGDFAVARVGVCGLRAAGALELLFQIDMGSAGFPDRLTQHWQYFFRCNNIELSSLASNDPCTSLTFCDQSTHVNMPGIDPNTVFTPLSEPPAAPLATASNLVLIDNYDSFTWNVYQYLVLEGATVTVYRNDEITLDELIAKAPSQLVISPGPGHPETDAGISKEAIKHFAGKIPVLGVCMGQ